MNSWITNRSMHTWTEEEISILKANADLTSEEIRSGFFPDLTISNINSTRRKHDCRKDRNWKPDKIERFCALYSKGGWNAVKKDPEFSDMSKEAINGAAHRYNVHSAASHPTLICHLTSGLRPETAILLRIQILSPFAALRGYEDEIRAEGINHLKGSRIELPEDVLNQCCLFVE